MQKHTIISVLAVLPLLSDPIAIHAQTEGEFGNPVLNPKIEISPSSPAPGEKTTIRLTGEYPTPGFAIEKADLFSASHSLFLEIAIAPPDGFVAQVVTPFEEDLAVFSPAEWTYYLRASINGEEIDPVEFTAGEPQNGAIENPAIVFWRTGGFAGDSSRVQISDDGRFEIFNRFMTPGGGPTASGKLSASDFDRIVEQMQAAMSSADRWIYPSTVPIADGFLYEIVYRKTPILVEQESAAPDAVSEAVERLEGILNDPPESAEFTNVRDWRVR